MGHEECAGLSGDLCQSTGKGGTPSVCPVRTRLHFGLMVRSGVSESCLSSLMLGSLWVPRIVAGLGGGYLKDDTAPSGRVPGCICSHRSFGKLWVRVSLSVTWCLPHRGAICRAPGKSLDAGDIFRTLWLSGGQWKRGRRIHGVNLGRAWGRPLGVQKNDAEGVGD